MPIRISKDDSGPSDHDNYPGEVVERVVVDVVQRYIAILLSLLFRNPKLGFTHYWHSQVHGTFFGGNGSNGGGKTKPSGFI